ncbi:hypothetical protein [Corallococcus sp. CA041A]|uniref:hypothetical protein n=1 Tax=Corallococcus sp. CA041A TaxID=2316727 RepID=UPI0011C349A6|nr:hypothetical protein [Corallococcus sp. CA041A]
MNVILDNSIFQSNPIHSLSLFEIFALGWDERHAILTNPPFDPAAEQPVNTWLTTLTDGLRKEAVQVLDQSIPLTLRRPRTTSRIRVVTAQSDWATATINIRDAVRLMRTPLKLLLENSRNDFNFLLRLASPTDRQDLKDAIKKGWIETEQAGGLGEMKNILLDLHTAPNAEISALIHKLRLWVMFDRDSEQADRSKPSKASEEVLGLCSEIANQKPWPLQFCQLGRRSIENYIPIEALRYWQNEASGSTHTERRRKVEALASLSKKNPQARWQYNMKSGLLGDLRKEQVKEIEQQGRSLRDTDLDPLFTGLTEQERTSLAEGFGKDIASLYLHHISSWETSFDLEYQQGPAHQPARPALLFSLFSRM